MVKTKFFIDATPIIEDRMSGVGHALAGLIEAISRHQLFMDHYEVVLVVPKGRIQLLDRWNFAQFCQKRQLPARRKIINGLIKFRLLPYMDTLLGRGVYLFANFRNWPLSAKSYSYTYIHDIAFAIHPEFVKPKNQRMLIRQVPHFIKRTNTLITVSEASRQEIIKYYKIAKDKIITIYNGYDEKVYHPYTDFEINSVKRKYGIKSAYLIFVGNIEPRKNLGRLIEAFQLLTESQPQYSLVLIGAEGWLNEPIHKTIDQARAAGRTIINPAVYVPDDEVAQLISGADLLIHPALHEGFGMPPLEALATDTPVVASDILVLKEILGGAASYFDPTDIKDIADQMRQVLTNIKLQQQLIEKGRKRRQLFSWQNSAEKLYQHVSANVPHDIILKEA